MLIAIKTPQGTFVTLDPNDNSLHFDRTVIGPWETFDTSDQRFFVIVGEDSQGASPADQSLIAPAEVTSIADLAERKNALLKWAESTFSLPPVAGSLAKIVSVLQSNGFPHARIADHHGAPSADKVDFGDGLSADIITGSDGPNPSWSDQPYVTPV